MQRLPDRLAQGIAAATGQSLPFHPARRAAHGQVTVALAPLLAAGAPASTARDIARRLAADPLIASAETGGVAFVNLTLPQAVWRDGLLAVLRLGPPEAPVFDHDGGLSAAAAADWRYDNPAFAVHYAHARARSVLRHGTVAAQALATEAVLSHLEGEEDLFLTRRTVLFPWNEPDCARFSAALTGLAADFHRWWRLWPPGTVMRCRDPQCPGVSQARLALVSGVATVIASALSRLGVAPKEELH